MENQAKTNNSGLSGAFAESLTPIETPAGIVSMPGNIGGAQSKKTREVTVIDLMSLRDLHPHSSLYLGVASTQSLEARYEKALGRMVSQGLERIKNVARMKKMPTELRALNYLVYCASAFKCSERVEYVFYPTVLPRKFDLVKVFTRYIEENADYLAMLAPYMQVQAPPPDQDYLARQALAAGDSPVFSETPADEVLSEAQDASVVTDVDFKEAHTPA